MSHINLIPPDHLRRRRAGRELRRWGTRLVVTALLLGGVHFWLRGHARRQVARAATLERQYVLLQEDLAIAEDLISERDRLAERFEAIRRIREGRPASVLVEVVGNALPSNTRLTHLHLDRHLSPAESTTPIVATPIVLRGIAMSHGDIGAFVRALDTAEVFRWIEVRTVTERSSSAERRTLDFELVCHLGERQDAG